MSAIVARAYRVRGMTAIETSPPMAERSTRRRTGAVERRNPLPKGRYWVDVFGKNIPRFDFWLETSPFVKVVTTETFEATSDFEARNWVLFDVENVTVWDPQFGFPTIAEPGVTSSADTSQRPPPEKPFELPSLQVGVTVGTIVIAVLLGLVLMRSFR